MRISRQESTAALTAVIFASVILAPPAWAQTAPPPRGPILSVKGEGVAEVKPDYASFTATVTTRGESLEAAASKHQDRAARSLAALEALKESGLEIDRSSFRLERQRSYNQDKPGKTPTKPVFQAITSYTLTIRTFDKLSELVTAIARTGLLEVASLHFEVDSDRAALNEARKAAIRDAKEQAEAYAEAANLQLVEVLEITDGEARSASDGAADLPLSPIIRIIPPAARTFNASVNVTWRIQSRP